MAQKLISLEEAADQLGISKEHLNELRAAGKVAGYRDGASWKFRSEVIDKLAVEGVPEIDPGASDLSLDLGDDASSSHVSSEGSELNLDTSGSDLGLAEDEVAGPASDISLEDVDEPTVAGIDDEGSDALALGDDEEIDLNADSILMSEAELGAKSTRPPSTIIGKAELDLDADLDLAPIEKGASPVSDVRLTADSGMLPSATADDDDLSLDLPSPSGNFEGLDELEIDLEAESSRIMSPDDVSKAKNAAKEAAKSKNAGLSDLGLAPGSSMGGVVSDINLGSSSGNMNLSGLSALELDDDDDQVLGEGSGSDVTLSGESSGINIISPSDSGLALDEVPLDLSGSAPIGSSLDLGESVGSDISLDSAGVSGIGSALGLGSMSGLGSKVGEDFQLTPLGETDEDDEKDSSQVIALDEIAEETAGSPLASGFGEAAMIGEDFGAVGGLAPGMAPVGVATAAEMPFSIWNVLGLAGCILMLGFCGMVAFDLLRSMWSWEGATRINSSLLEALNPFLGR